VLKGKENVLKIRVFHWSVCPAFIHFELSAVCALV